MHCFELSPVIYLTSSWGLKKRGGGESPKQFLTAQHITVPFLSSLLILYFRFVLSGSDVKLNVFHDSSTRKIVECLDNGRDIKPKIEKTKYLYQRKI